jgi:hypothetical protein
MLATSARLSRCRDDDTLCLTLIADTGSSMTAQLAPSLVPDLVAALLAEMARRREDEAADAA